MKEKIIGWFKTVASKTKRGASKDSMRIVCLYGAGLAIITFLLLWAWVYTWFASGKPDIPTLLSFFKEYTAPTVIAAVTFLSVFHVDKNRDGRPDIAETKAKENKL